MGIQAAVKLNEEALAKAKAKSDKIEAKCKNIQQQIMDAGGPKLKMQKTKVCMSVCVCVYICNMTSHADVFVHCALPR
jgi:hypothetical protein